MINELYLATTNLKSKFNCAKCKICNNEPYRINICGHMYCKKCITSINICLKCNISFSARNICLDKHSSSILNRIETLEALLQTSNPHKDSKSLSSSRLATEQSEKIEPDQIVDSELFDNKFLDCDCSNYCEISSKQNSKELVKKKNAVGETKLHLACKKGNEIEVKTLLHASASVNAQDYANWTPLHEAVIVGNKNIVQWLLNNGSVVNAPGYNYETPLHKAIILKNKEIAKLLIKHGADKYSKNYEGVSPWDLVDTEMKLFLENIKSNSVPILKAKLWNYKIFLLGELTKELQVKVDDFCKIFPANVTTELNEQVTHVVTISSSKFIEASYEFLLAILYCIPVITIEWLEASISVERIVDSEEYNIIGTEQLFQCNINARTQINKFKLNPKLFSGCYFYLARSKEKAKPFMDLNAERLRRLILVGGGEVLKREPVPGALGSIRQPWHAANNNVLAKCCHYVLYDAAEPPLLRYNMIELKHVPYNWLVYSILQYQLIVPE